jgi:hypothetical protein
MSYLGKSKEKSYIERERAYIIGDCYGHKTVKVGLMFKSC